MTHDLSPTPTFAEVLRAPLNVASLSDEALTAARRDADRELIARGEWARATAYASLEVETARRLLVAR